MALDVQEWLKYHWNHLSTCNRHTLTERHNLRGHFVIRMSFFVQFGQQLTETTTNQRETQ